MNKSQAILTILLAATEDDPLPTHVVTARVQRRWPSVAGSVGLNAHSCARSLSQMFSRGRISRVKTKAVAGYCYYLSREQRATCFAPAVYPHAAAFTAIVGPAAAMVERIRFLQRLKGLPAFTGEAVVDAMLGDYVRAHEVAVLAEEVDQHRVDEEARRVKQEKRRADERAAAARSRARGRGESKSGAAEEVTT